MIEISENDKTKYKDEYRVREKNQRFICTKHFTTTNVPFDLINITIQKIERKIELKFIELSSLVSVGAKRFQNNYKEPNMQLV